MGEAAKSYNLLEKRIAREKQLLVAQKKMEIKTMLQVGIFISMSWNMYLSSFAHFSEQETVQT